MDVPPAKDPETVTGVPSTVFAVRRMIVPENYAPAAVNAMNAESAAAVKSPSTPDPASVPV